MEKYRQELIESWVERHTDAVHEDRQKAEAERGRVHKDEKGSKGSKSASSKSEANPSTVGSKPKERGYSNSKARGKQSKRGKETESRQGGSQHFGGKKVAHDGDVNGSGKHQDSNDSSGGEGGEGDNYDRFGPRSAVPTTAHAPNSQTRPTAEPFTYTPTLTRTVITSAPSNLTADICSAFYAGNARRTGSQQDYKVRFVLDVDENADQYVVLEDMGTILNEDITPFLLGCEEPQQATRVLQSVSSEYANVIFSNPVRDSGRTCTTTLNTSVCIPTIFDSELYFDGPKPSGFEQELSQVLQSWDWSSVDGFLSIRRIEVAQVENSTPVTSSSQTSRASIIYVSTALLSALLVVIILAKRIRKNMISCKPTYAWLTDVDELCGAGRAMDSISHPNKAVRFDEQITCVSFECRSSGKELGSQWRTDGNPTHRQELECSSPSCFYCELKRQSGIGNAPVIDSGLTWPNRRDPSYPYCGVEDCVFL